MYQKAFELMDLMSITSVSVTTSAKPRKSLVSIFTCFCALGIRLTANHSKMFPHLKRRKDSLSIGSLGMSPLRFQKCLRWHWPKSEGLYFPLDVRGSEVSIARLSSMSFWMDRISVMAYHFLY